MPPAATISTTVRSAAELGLPEPEETGETFAANAALKARASATAGWAALALAGVAAAATIGVFLGLPRPLLNVFTSDASVVALGITGDAKAVLQSLLGATRAQIGRILLAEYALLGLLGASAGMLLSFAGAWGLITFVFGGHFAPAVGSAMAIAGAMMALAIAIGMATGRDVFRETPMAALRES